MTPDEISAGARKVLNKHGHPFQYAVLRRFVSLYRSGPSPFRFVVSEFPVELGGRNTSIDFILTNERRPQLVVAECKRADPKLARWVFARSPLTRDGETELGTYISGVVWDTSSGRLQELTYHVADARPFHIPFELRTNQEGDGRGHDTKSIDEAAKQVFLGTAGLLGALSDDPRLLLEENIQHAVIPTIFTTAELFVVNEDISTALLTTGAVENVSTSRVDWLWYQTNLSRDLRASVQPKSQGQEQRALEQAVVHRHTRATLIVSVANPEALRSFVELAHGLRPTWL